VDNGLMYTHHLRRKRRMQAKKISGDTGNSGFNTSLGKPNPTPSATTPSGSLKNKGVYKLSTRLPYDSRKGEIRDHRA
jgi:hypothetical protein